MSAVVRVTTGSRLHFGPLAVGAIAGRRFGGVGLMVAEPQLRLTAVAAETDVVLNGEEVCERVAATLQQLRHAVGPRVPQGVAVRIERELPLHHGFGAGTQLALAVAQAALGARRIPPAQLAAWVGRGARSAIGVHGFEHGGWLVDAGKRAESYLGTLAARLEFPTEWPILLWSSPAVQGLAGACERSVIESLPAMSAATTDRLAAVVLRELLPSIVDRDWAGFAQGLRTYGDLVGAFFAPVQGGLYADPRGAEVVAWLDRRGLGGVAQSSWGPTLAVVLPDEETAVAVVRDWPFERERLMVTVARNHGAEVETVR